MQLWKLTDTPLFRVHGRDQNVCRDTWVEKPLYQEMTHALLRQNSRKVLYQNLEQMETFLRTDSKTDNAGTTYVDEPIPPYKVDVAYVRPRKRSPYTKAQFEKWKKEGKIVVTPVSLGEIRVKDRVTVENPVLIGKPEMRFAGPTASAICRPFRNGCDGMVDVYAPATDELAGSHISHFDPGTSGTNQVRYGYSGYEGPASTVLTIHRSKVQSSVNAIRDSVRNAPIDGAIVTEAAAELNAAIFDLSTELGELPETVGMIYQGLMKALKMYKEARQKVFYLKKHYQNFKVELATAIAEVWMTYRYGIMPIVYSIEDGLKLLEFQGRIFRTVRKRSDVVLQPKLPDGVVLTDPLILKRRCWAKARLDAATLKSGLGVNLPLTAWELLPLSFVVDWFLNVGEFLQAFNPSINFDERVFTYSTQIETSSRMVIDDVHEVFVDIKLYDRFNINPIDHIGLQFEPLLTVKRQLDALSLTWLMFLKGLKIFKE